MKHFSLVTFFFAIAFSLTACSDDDSFIQRPSDGLPAEVADKAEQDTSDQPKPGSSSTTSSSSTQKSSSSSVKSSSSVTPESSSGTGGASPCSALPGGVCDYGSLTDSRDGQTYKTVTIGTQTWMAENLNYETANSDCYKDSSAYCAKYGRLYTWAAAMDSVGEWSTSGQGCGYNEECSPTYPVRGVCPSGWHLPDRTEFLTLITAVGGVKDEVFPYLWNGGGTALKSTSGWNDNDGESGNGTDAFGFSALPAGLKLLHAGYYDEGEFVGFWSSTGYVFDSEEAYHMDVGNNFDSARLLDYPKDYSFSVRCLKD